MWQKILSAILIVMIAATAILLYFQKQKNCCLCSSLRYHAPCLIDLETGEIIELELYLPHGTLVAELADPQPEQGTFSLIRLGNVTGYTDTANRIVEINVPSDEKAINPVLCRDCRKQLKNHDFSRYALADLYDKDAKMLIPIRADNEITLRCYGITMQYNHEKEGIAVRIQGILPVLQ